MNHKNLGKWGELFACEYLQTKGYTILEKNWKYKRSEIDILCQKDDGVLVVVEVKTRNSDFFGDPQTFVSLGQRKTIVKVTDAYINEHNLDVEVRCDIIAILKNAEQETLTHFENAFYHF